MYYKKLTTAIVAAMTLTGMVSAIALADNNFQEINRPTSASNEYVLDITSAYCTYTYFDNGTRTDQYVPFTLYRPGTKYGSLINEFYDSDCYFNVNSNLFEGRFNYGPKSADDSSNKYANRFGILLNGNAEIYFDKEHTQQIDLVGFPGIVKIQIFMADNNQLHWDTEACSTLYRTVAYDENTDSYTISGNFYYHPYCTLGEYLEPEKHDKHILAVKSIRITYNCEG